MIVAVIRTFVGKEVSRMNDNYHIFSDGVLKRENDTLRFNIAGSDEFHFIPVKKVEAIYSHGQIEFNTRLLSLLDEYSIGIYVFDWTDSNVGSFSPTSEHISGKCIVEQVRAYDNLDHRTEIAKKIVAASIVNMRATTKRTLDSSEERESILSDLDASVSSLEEASTVQEVLGAEAMARSSYYSLYRVICKNSEFEFTTREYYPPPDPVNALISFINSLLYSQVDAAICSTALDPTISFLHEPRERRQSLALDIADLFKPLIADTVIISLIRQNSLSVGDFTTSDGCCQLASDEAKKQVIQKYEDKLETTIQHKTLNRPVSYQYLLQLDAYELKNHLMTGEEYTPFRKWW